MYLRLKDYTAALVWLAATAAIYQFAATTWLKPPVVEPYPLAKGPALIADASLSDLFPDGAWQRGLCKRLQTDDGALLFENWEQSSDDHWKLWPVTLVLGRGMSGATDRDPIIMEAFEGAEIKFTESLDVMSGGAPPIDRGRMIGQVHIRQTNRVPNKESLDIRTANVGIDNRKIWTTEAIQMRIGDARLLGRDLTIHLAATAGAAAAGSIPSEVLDRMELIYLDELVIPLADGGLWQTVTKPIPGHNATNVESDRPAMISLQCGGRVEYDFARDQLSLRDSVSLIHEHPNTLQDRFDCQSIRLTLRDPANDKIARNGPLDWLVKVTAEGTPAVARLPSFECELRAETIDLDAVKGLLTAGGKTGVQAKRGTIRGRLDHLVYQFDPDHPQVLGAIDAVGRGIVQIDDPKMHIRRMQWQDGLRVHPADVTTTHRLDSMINVWIDGAVEALLADGGQFKADAIEGVLKPVAAKSPSDSNPQLAPDRFKATGNVRIDASTIAAETQTLQLFFVDPPAPNPSADLANDSSGSMRNWIVQPGQGDTSDPIARSKPIIRGDHITAQLSLSKTGAVARDLSVTGSVELEHTINTGGQSLPARMTGEQLRLIDGGGDDVLQLGSGVHSPARFELGDGYFIGPMIQIRPSDNIVWINDAGEFQMPTATLPTGLAGDDPSRIQWTSAPHCRWRGEMIFDGRTATLTDGVDVTASLLNGREPWDMHMTGDRLEVVLRGDVQVRDVRTIRTAAVQQVALMQSSDKPVIVEAQRRAADGILEARHLLHASQLTLMPGGGGTLIGAGPGWYRSWMITPKQGPLGNESAARPMDGSQRNLTGVHLIFHDSLQGNMTNKSLEFLRGIRVGIRPVRGWEDAFDAGTMDAISAGESTLDCDRLRLTVAPGFPAGSRRIAGVPQPWEMEAVGGVVFRTRNERGLFDGTASRASYASAKDLFTVRGAPNRAALFRQTQPSGQPGPELAVKEMTLRPNTMEIQNLQLERLNLGTLPNMNNR